ncbi:hypothetical protein Tco_1484545 [Tanacetum coccineum]
MGRRRSKRVGSTTATAPTSNYCDSKENAKNKWLNDQEEQCSPVSVMDFPSDNDTSVDDEDDVSSTFHNRHLHVEGRKLMHKTRRFEIVPQLEPVRLEDRIAQSESSTQTCLEHAQEDDQVEKKAMTLLQLTKSTVSSHHFMKHEAVESLLLAFFKEEMINEHVNELAIPFNRGWSGVNGDVTRDWLLLHAQEDDQVEKKAMTLLQLTKSTVSSHHFMKHEAVESLLLAFFKEEMINEHVSYSEMLQVAKDWMDGQMQEMFLDWECEDDRITYIREMEKTFKWSKYGNELEKENLVLELEYEIFSSLIGDILLDFQIFRQQGFLKTGLAAALEELPASTIAEYDNVIQKKAYSALILCLGKSQSEHIDEFHKLVGDLASIDTVISDEDQTLLLLTSLPSSYGNFMETLLYGRDTLKLEDVLATFNSRELQKMTEAKGDGVEGLYVRGRSGQRDMEQGTDSTWSKVTGKKQQTQVSGYRADGYGSADVMMAMGDEELLDWIMDSGGSYHITYMRDYLVDFEEGFTVKMQSSKIKVIKGSLMVLSGTRRSNCVYTLDGQAVISKTLKGRKQLGEYQTGWKIKTGNVLDSCNQSSTQQCTKSGVAKHLGVVGIHQRNGLVEEMNMTLLAKTPIDMLGFFGWLASIKQGMLEPVKVKCIFLGYRKGIEGNKALEVLQGVEFEVEPQEDHTFEVEPHGNVDHVVVAIVEMIYAHESLTFNNTVACEVISKWKAGLKDDMDARSDVYVLNNDCKKCSDHNDVY